MTPVPGVLSRSFILGAAKCGTTSLANWLGQHPDICMSDPKEPKYYTMEYHNGPEWYNKQYFSHYCGESVAVDARPQNLMVHFVTERILESTVDPRFIVMVRDPIERAYSAWHHFHMMRPGREPDGFESVMSRNFMSYRHDIFTHEREYMAQVDPRGGCYDATYLEMGNYIHHIKRYVESFGRKSIKVMLLDDMVRDPVGLVTKAQSFLGVKVIVPAQMPRLKSAEFPTESLDLPIMFPGLFSRLAHHFKPQVRALGNFIDRDLVEEWGYTNHI